MSKPDLFFFEALDTRCYYDQQGRLHISQAVDPNDPFPNNTSRVVFTPEQVVAFKAWIRSKETV